jgi:tetratricopeptide (TPR) repeat protein
MRHIARIAGAAGAVAVALLAGSGPASQAPERFSLSEHQRRMRDGELRLRFDQAVVMLHARQYEHAATALQRVLELAPELPEGRVNLGYALLGLRRADAARAAFLSAVALRTEQANAYYGLALAEEQRQDYESALGAMRSYLHLAPADAAHRVRARAALWEWEAKLGRVAAAPVGAASRP